MSVPFRGVRYDVVSGGVSDPRVVAGTADPSAGGLAAPEGSLYLRFVGGAGEAYIKTAVTDTDWTQVGSGGGGTLNDAYVAGRTITASANAVVVTSAAADNNNILEIVKNPGGAQSGSGLSVTMNGATTGSAILVAQSGSGSSIETSPGSAAAPAWKFTGGAGGLFQSGANIVEVSDGTNSVAAWGAKGAVVLSPTAVTSGLQTHLTLTGAAHLGLTASTENPDIILNLQRTITYATGALAQHRAAIVLAPTIAFAGASVIADASTWYIAGPPVEGSLATITNPAALHVDTGVSRLDDGVEFIERAAATRSIPAGRGLLWLRNDSPSVLVFTDDTNVDTVLGVDSTASYERHASFGVSGGTGGSTQEATLGRITFSGSIIGLSVHMEDARTAGSVTVNVKKNTVTQFSAVIDGANPEWVTFTQASGTDTVAAGDEITVEVVADAGYDNTGSVVTGLVANVTCNESIASAATNVALLDAAQTFTAGQAVAQVTLADGAGIVVDGDASNNFQLELTQNSDLANPTNVVVGMTINVAIRQDGTGGFTCGFGTAYLFPGGAPTITAGAGTEDIISCYVRAEAAGVATAMLCSIAQDHIV